MYGLRTINPSGILQIDSTLPPMRLVSSGFAAAGGNWNPGNSGSWTDTSSWMSLSVPSPATHVVFLRAPLNQKFMCGNIVSGSLRYKSTGLLEYRIYQLGVANSAQSGHGLVVRNSHGTVVFNTGDSYPLIGQVITSTIVPSGGWQGYGEKNATSFPISVQSHDGGLPFVSASSLTMGWLWYGITGGFYSIGMWELRGLACRFTSSGSISLFTETHNRFIASGGQGLQKHTLGVHPHTLLIAGA